MYYGMFTDEGNKIVQNIVDVARQGNLSWTQVQYLMEHTYKHNEFLGKHTEILDTAVLDEVYIQLGFDKA